MRKLKYARKYLSSGTYYRDLYLISHNFLHKKQRLSETECLSAVNRLSVALLRRIIQILKLGH